MKITYQVGGMTCQGCVNAVTRALQQAAPGAVVAVDLAAGRVAVEANADDRTLRQAILDAGYELNGAPA